MRGSSGRLRVNPATLIALLALFVALGGTVYAAGKINGKTVKRNSLPGNRIKAGSVTGLQVDESSLGQVPSAKSADSAVDATSAASANGQTPLRIFAKVPEGAGNTTIASVAGFTFVASCPAPGGNPNADLALVAPNVDSDLEAEGNGSGAGGGAFAFGDTGPSATLLLDRNGALIDNERGETSFSGATTTGTVISGQVGYDDSQSFTGEPFCAFYGEALAGG